jgi:hypothetical protein
MTMKSIMVVVGLALVSLGCRVEKAAEEVQFEPSELVEEPGVAVIVEEEAEMVVDKELAVGLEATEPVEELVEVSPLRALVVEEQDLVDEDHVRGSARPQHRSEPEMRKGRLVRRGSRSRKHARMSRGRTGARRSLTGSRNPGVIDRK